MMSDCRVYRARDWPECEGGLACAECGYPFTEGQPISEKLFAMDEFALGPMFCVEIVCRECSLGVPRQKYRATGRIEPIFTSDLDLIDNEE